MDEEVKKNLAKISRSLTKKTSYKHNFTMSIVTGIGAAIGATIVFGIIITLMSQVMVKSADYPKLNELFNALGLPTVVENYQK
jgi:hypothetical protein